MVEGRIITSQGKFVKGKQLSKFYFSVLIKTHKVAPFNLYLTILVLPYGSNLISKTEDWKTVTMKSNKQECFVVIMVPQGRSQDVPGVKNFSDASDGKMKVKEIIAVYSSHPSIQKIKNCCPW